MQNDEDYLQKTPEYLAKKYYELYKTCKTQQDKENFIFMIVNEDVSTETLIKVIYLLDNFVSKIKEQSRQR